MSRQTARRARSPATRGAVHVGDEEREQNFRRYIVALLGPDNVHPAAIDAIAEGKVEWDEVARAGEHWRRCTAALAAERSPKAAAASMRIFRRWRSSSSRRCCFR